MTNLAKAISEKNLNVKGLSGDFLRCLGCRLVTGPTSVVKMSKSRSSKNVTPNKDFIIM